MQKVLRLILLFIFFWFGLALLVAWVFFKHFGDIRPVLLPAATESPGTPQTPGGNLPAAGPLHVPSGFQIGILSEKVPGARDLQITPGGNLLVSAQKPGKVFALPLQETAQPQPKEILSNLHNPHGLAFYHGKLFVAEETHVDRYTWDEQHLTATFERKIIDLPDGGSGLHHSRSIVFDKEGRLFISLGSTCNICEEKNPWNAAVVMTDENGSNPQVFAKGLRNAVFLTVNPDTNQVWVTDMGRDLLGDNIPPDEINILQQNGNYGGPYCYGNKIWDQKFNKESSEYCQNTLAPNFEIPAHSAPLGLAFVQSAQFPTDWQGDLLISYHGSWNRTVPDGYKVVRIKRNGDQLGPAEDFITGFLQGNQTYGRPVDLTFDSTGNLYISDDKAGRVYRVGKQ